MMFFSSATQIDGLKSVGYFLLVALFVAGTVEGANQEPVAGTTHPTVQNEAKTHDEELAGEQEAGQAGKVQPPVALQAPSMQEPETSSATMTKNRPILKMPEVIVKGDRDFRITSERKDLLFMDPMQGAKEVPDDMAHVAIPGLDEQKDMPAADTVTAKNYLFSLEAGGGFHHWAEGQLTAGLELNQFNAVLQSSYSAKELPDAFGFSPFDQLGEAHLDLGVTALQDVRFFLGLSAKSGASRQPLSLNHWGDWVERIASHLQLGCEFYLAKDSKVNLQASGNDFIQQGTIGASGGPQLKSRAVALKANWEYSLKNWLHNDMVLLADLNYQSADTRLEVQSNFQEVQENLSSVALTARYRPFSFLMAELGVKTDDFHGAKDQALSTIQAQLSGTAPTETTVYAMLDNGLHWERAAEWAFEHPRPSIFLGPQPEKIQMNLKTGVQQKIGEMVAVELTWTLLQATDTPAWVDPDHDGLFTLVNLEQSRVQAGEMALEINYSRYLSQKFSYTQRWLTSQLGLVLPNTPVQEGKTELRLDYEAISADLTYRYLGIRYTDSNAQSPTLTPAHLLSLGVDVRIHPMVTIVVKAENLLNVSWEEWQGYLGNGIVGMAGLRVTF